VAKETRKIRRAAEREQSPGKGKKADMSKPLSLSQGEPQNPLGPDQLKSTFTRVGLIVLAIWMVGLLVFGIANEGSWVRIVALAVPAVLTLVVVGTLVWTLRQAKKAQGVASILRGVETADDRKAALEKLEADYKKGDPAKLFAKAQLEMQEDPRKALATLEQINVDKVMGTIADEARGQRAMIHLTLGEVNQARQLSDNIDLKRQQDARSRAMLGAIVAEAWARSGQAQKAVETLDLFDLEDAQLEPLKPQIYRAYAYAYAHQTKTRELKGTLRKMLAIDARLLGGFMVKKTHPLLQKEAKRMIEQSGIVPRKMQIQRRP
jgi:hypothetical protein